MRKYTRKITKVGKLSYSVVIPRELVEELKWREKQKVTLKRSGSKIIVEDWER